MERKISIVFHILIFSHHCKKAVLPIQKNTPCPGIIFTLSILKTSSIQYYREVKILHIFISYLFVFVTMYFIAIRNKNASNNLLEIFATAVEIFAHILVDVPLNTVNIHTHSLHLQKFTRQ